MFFYREDHPEIFEAPLYKRKSMCLEILDKQQDLVDPIVRGQWMGKEQIELLVHSH